MHASDRRLHHCPQEVGILKSLNYDRNIVQFYGACLRPGGDPLLVCEYMEGEVMHALDPRHGSFNHRSWSANMHSARSAADASSGAVQLHSAHSTASGNRPCGQSRAHGREHKRTVLTNPSIVDCIWQETTALGLLFSSL